MKPPRSPRLRVTFPRLSFSASGLHLRPSSFALRPSTSPLLQPSLLQQRLDDGVAAGEGAVHGGGFFRAAAGEAHVAEPLAVGARHPAMFREPGVGVVVEDFAP